MRVRRSGWQAVAVSILQEVALTISAFLTIFVLVAGFPTTISREGALPTEEGVHSHADPFVTVVTAYSSTPEETNGDPFITASGRRVRPGIVACSQRYPFGTKFLIEGRVYVCLDRLAPRYDHRIDIWKPSRLEAIHYGKRQLQVRILLGEA